MKKLLVLFEITFLLIVIGCIISYIFDFNSFLKNIFGGIVINKSDKTIIITDSKDKIKLPPGKSSRSIGVFDADTIMISSSTFLDGKEYKSGVVKFCDTAVMEVTNYKSGIEIKPNLASNFCKLINDYKWLKDLDDINY